MSDLARRLTAAAKAKQRSRVRDLLRKGADPNADGGSAMWAAIRWPPGLEDREPSCLRMLLDAGGELPDPIERAPGAGWTSLHSAAEVGNAEAVLLVLGGDPDAPAAARALAAADTYAAAAKETSLRDYREKAARGTFIGGLSPVICSVPWASGEFAGVADLLLRAGADIDARDYCGVTSLQRAAGITNRDPYLFPVRWRRDRPARGGAAEAVAFLAARGAGVDAPDRSGMSPLMYACRSGRGPTAAALVRAGADVAAVDDNGATALHIAYWYPEIVELLLSAGARADATDRSGREPLHYACISLGFTYDPQSTLRSIRLLLRAGGSLSRCDNDGHSPMRAGGHHYRSDIRQIQADVRSSAGSLTKPARRAPAREPH